MKKFAWILIGIVLGLSLLWYSSKEIEKSNEIKRHQEEMIQTAVQKMMDGQEEEAVTIIDDECADVTGAYMIRDLCLALESYEDNRITEAYNEVRYYSSASYSYLTEAQNSWVTGKISEIKTAKEVYDQEQKKLKAERKAQEEAEKLQKLKESGIPYVGMSEDLIAETSLGRPRDTVRHNYETKSGKVYMANLYDFPNVGYVTFTARCVNGRVTEVFDGRKNGGVNPKYLTLSGSSSSGSKKYATAEDLYEDRPDDFDSLEDAENYFDDHY